MQQGVAAMQQAATETHRYPDGHATALRRAIGKRFGLDPARIVCGNGSDELIAHLVLAYGGEGTELVMSAHGFAIYEITGRYAGCPSETGSPNVDLPRRAN
jgi:histidinol-phosphate aminotransferase